MKTFEALTGFFDNEDWCVWIYENGVPLTRLDPHLEVMNKSPTGFAWGYHGSGPAQLAFALLAEVIGVSRAREPWLFQEFKREVIAKFPPDKGWMLTENAIKEWVARHEAEAV